jgi:hypothetical protein
MSLFGKLLAIFNVLAAIAFFSVAVLDYSQRQAWSFAVVRADTLILGLPFDENETTVDGDKRTEHLDAKVLNEIFSNAGGIPQPTQLAEVRRVKGIVDTHLAQSPSPDDIEALRKDLVEGKPASAGPPPTPAVPPVLPEKSKRLGSQIMQLMREIALEQRTKNRPEIVAALTKELTDVQKKKSDLDADILAFSKKDGLDAAAQGKLKDILQERRLSALLLPFASSSGEFEEFADGTTSTEAKPLGGLQGKLSAIFDEVLLGQVKANELSKGAEQAGSTHKIESDERKLATARLLFNLIGAVPNSGYAAGAPGLQRVIAVCGLANTAHAIQAQTVASNKMAQDLTYTIDRERSDFVTETHRLMGRSQDLADELRKQQLNLRAQEDLVSRQTDLVKALDANIVKLNEWLAAAKNSTQDRLAEQSAMEKSLFEARHMLRDTQALNEKLEQQIREMEKAKGP